MDYSAIILAAGQGKRLGLGYNKIFLKMNGQPLITYSLKMFLNDPFCKQVIVVCNSLEEKDFKDVVKQYNLEDNRISYTHGGRERQDSVVSGLKKANEEIVLIHDGARPLITQNLISLLVETTTKYFSAIPGIRVVDTIKKVNESKIVETVQRDNLIAVHTPQAFKTNIIKSAYELAYKSKNVQVTDDASILEQFSDYSPYSLFVDEIIKNYINIKVTKPSDIPLVEFLLNSRGDNNED